MIRVIIENVPDVTETRIEQMGILKIKQTDSSKEDWSDFEYMIDNDVERSGSISNHFKANSIWKLIYKILGQEYAE